MVVFSGCNQIVFDFFDKNKLKTFEFVTKFKKN